MFLAYTNDLMDNKIILLFKISHRQGVRRYGKKGRQGLISRPRYRN
jgi:hypothetical protein